MWLGKGRRCLLDGFGIMNEFVLTNVKTGIHCSKGGIRLISTE